MCSEPGYIIFVVFKEQVGLRLQIHVPTNNIIDEQVAKVVVAREQKGAHIARKCKCG